LKKYECTLFAFDVHHADGSACPRFCRTRGVRREITTQAPELQPEVDGMVKQIFEVAKPWQLLNPAAPASYGNGEKNVSKDSGAGTPYHAVTLTVVGVEW
jgi:hypothetical protein